MFEFFLSFGQWKIQVRSSHPCPRELRSSGSLHPTPDFVLEIVSPQEFSIPSRPGVPEFTIEKGSVRLCTDRENGVPLIRACFADSQAYSGYRYLEMLLSRAFYSLCAAKGQQSFLVHSSAAACNGVGFLFIGPSGSGKTTVASRSWQKNMLLHDELTVLHSEADGFTLQGSPFHSDLPINPSAKVPLGAVLFLQHGSTLSIRPVKRGEAFTQVFTQVAPPMSLDPEALQLVPDRLDSLFAVCSHVATGIPTYKMRFSLSDDIWPAIESLPTAVSRHAFASALSS